MSEYYRIYVIYLFGNLHKSMSLHETLKETLSCKLKQVFFKRNLWLKILHSEQAMNHSRKDSELCLLSLDYVLII